MQTGLVLHVPEVRSIVGPIRRKHDPAASVGMPPHVTLIYPFMDSRAFDAAARRRLNSVCATTSPISMRFKGCGMFDRVLWLAPEPEEPIIGLVRSMAAAFPDYPPFGGAFAEIIPHLTVAHGDPSVFPKLQRRLERALASALEAEVRQISWFGLSEEGWIELGRFDLTG